MFAKVVLFGVADGLVLTHIIGYARTLVICIRMREDIKKCFPVFVFFLFGFLLILFFFCLS